MLKKLFNRKQSDTPAIDSNAIPKHVAIIMDGNGRWAKQQNKLRIFGHTNGVAAVRRAVSYARQTGVKFLTLI